MHSELYFCPCPRQKNVEFSAWSGDLVDVEDVLMGSSEYSVRVIELVSFLLHSNSSNLVHEISKNEIWGTICISVLHYKFRVTHSHSHSASPWSTPMHTTRLPKDAGKIRWHKDQRVGSSLLARRHDLYDKFVILWLLDLVLLACMHVPRAICCACFNFFLYLFLMILWENLSRDPPDRFWPNFYMWLVFDRRLPIWHSFSIVLRDVAMATNFRVKIG